LQADATLETAHEHGALRVARTFAVCKLMRLLQPNIDGGFFMRACAAPMARAWIFQISPLQATS